VIAALTVAALPVDQFRFVGFLPRSGRRRREALTQLAQDSAATVVFESPRRLLDTLDELAQVLGADRQIAVCRELTKLHEEVVRGAAKELADHFRQHPPRGEITFIVSGGHQAGPELSEPDLEERIAALYRSGVPTKQAAAQLAGETGLRKQELYARIEAYKAALAESEQDESGPAD
jgi:16S rRNA (cytidine1402-2'-O)-methyltransferase